MKKNVNMAMQKTKSYERDFSREVFHFFFPVKYLFMDIFWYR